MKLFSFKEKEQIFNPYKTYTEPQLIQIPINPRRKNYDFEIISRYICDDEGNEYSSKEEALQMGVDESVIKDLSDPIDESIKNVYRFEYNLTDEVNKFNAWKCDLGVVRWLEEKAKGQEFMYALDPNANIEISILCYGYLTHKYVDKQILKKIKKNKDLQIELQLIAGKELHKELMNII